MEYTRIQKGEFNSIEKFVCFCIVFTGKRVQITNAHASFRLVLYYPLYLRELRILLLIFRTLFLILKSDPSVLQNAFKFATNFSSFLFVPVPSACKIALISPI